MLDLLLVKKVVAKRPKMSAYAKTIVANLQKSVFAMSPLGPKQIEQGRGLLKSAVPFGIAGVALGCYVMEWKAVLRFLPYYNGKYED